MHSCHHAYRYIFSLFGRRGNRFFIRLLGLFIMLLLVFLSRPEERESWEGGKISISKAKGKEIDSSIELGGFGGIEELGVTLKGERYSGEFRRRETEWWSR